MKAVGSGIYCLHGRPRPLPLAPLLEEHDPIPPRATIKALPSTPHRPRPYGSPGILPDFPTEVDAYWAHSLCPPGEHPTGRNELRPYAHFPLFPYLKCIGPCACPRGPAIPVGSTLSAILPVLWNNC